MRKSAALVVSLVALGLVVTVPHTRADSATALSLGTTGVGIELIYSLGHKLNARVVGQYGGFELDYEETDIEYDAEYESINFGAMLDWHPFGGSFRLTGGLVRTNFGVELDASTRNEQFELGDETYISQDGVNLFGEAEFNDVAPYLALGWSSNLDNDGLYFGGEIGLMYVGSARLSYGANGCVNVEDNAGDCVVVSAVPEFQDDLEQERQDIEDDLEDYSLWPILAISIGYRF